MPLTDTAFKRIYEYLFSTSTLLGTFYRPQTCMDEMQMAVHEGVGFIADGYNAALANGASEIFIGITGSKEVHFLGLDVTTASGGWLIELYESPTITSNGTLYTPVNLNFQSSYTNNMTLYTGGTVSANGTLKLHKNIHPIGTGAANRVDTDGGLKGGAILKKNTTYMFKITNNSGATNAYESHMFWAEK
jgi:hypothetical protein